MTEKVVTSIPMHQCFGSIWNVHCLEHWWMHCWECFFGL